MNADPFKPLQEVIDQEHAEAISALETLRRYLSHRGYSLEIRTAGANGSLAENRTRKARSGPTKRKKAKGGKQSFRSQVDQAVQREFRSIGELATITGLEKKQVRGVLYSPILADLYQRKKSATKEMTFKLKSKVDTAE